MLCIHVHGMEQRGRVGVRGGLTGLVRVGWVVAGVGLVALGMLGASSLQNLTCSALSSTCQDKIVAAG
jgi:hypothetical protein